MYAGALFIKLAFGLAGLSGLYLSILILLTLAAFFTIFGGLSAVIWTDFIQAIIMVIGALVLMFISECFKQEGIIHKHDMALSNELNFMLDLDIF